jgi:hypothetical protein
LVNLAYVNSLLAQNLSQASVDTMINAAYNGVYVTKAYVDTQDVLNATKAFIDAGDATRLLLSSVGNHGSAAPLLSNGRIAPARISAASTQRWPKAFYTPAGYNTGIVTAGGTETQLYPAVSVPDPGFVYKLFVSGLQDVYSNVDGEYAVIRVRVGSMTGPVIAGAYGLGESYPGGVLTQYTSGTNTYTVPSWAGAVDAICLGAGGGGQDGSSFFGIPRTGGGGQAGTFSSATLTRGTTLPGGTGTLTAVVGVGGTNNTDGTASVVTGTGVTPISGAGGPNSTSPDGSNGAGVGSLLVLNGQTYTGGVHQTVINNPSAGVTSAGNPPGGGGPGGTGGIVAGDIGGTGAPGSIWFFAYPLPNFPSASATIIPNPMNAQAAITGATSLYVTIQRAGGTTSTQSASTVNPKLFIVLFPA